MSSDSTRNDPRGAASAKRDRTLIVCDGPGMSELAQLLRRTASTQGHKIDEVDDLYDALAAVGVASSHHAATGVVQGEFEAVAVPLRATGDNPRMVGDAFRRVDPSLRMVLLAPRGASAVAEEAGFDEIVYLPAGSQDLNEALRLTRVEGSAKTAEEVVVPDAPMGDRTVRPMPVERHSPMTPSVDSVERRDMVDLVIDEALQTFAARRRRTPDDRSVAANEIDVAPTRPLSDSIGDTDLVEAVIEGSDRLTATALELIRRELRIDDVRLIVGDEPVATSSQGDEERSVIRWKGVTLGALASTQTTADTLAPWADWIGHWLRLGRLHDDLRVLAWTDELTGAGNRRAFERVLDETIAAARPERQPVSLMYFDIDNFKSYNDRFGHEAGDDVLRETLELLRAVIRRGDHVFRVGGDEFVVIFADSRGGRVGGGSFESIETIATRFRQRVAELKFPQLGLHGPGTVSISAGVATYPWDGHDSRSLLTHADQLALQSKRSGKNMITFGPGATNHCRDG